MASLFAIGFSKFSPQPTSDYSKLLKVFHPKPYSLKFLFLKTLNPTRFFKVRANDGTEPSDKLQQYFQNQDYDKKYGFLENIDSFTIPKGLSEETIRLISKLKKEPAWILEYRLKAYAKFLKLEEPKWSDNRYPLLDLQDMCFYSAPKKKPTLNSSDIADEADDPKLLEEFDRLDVPLTKKKKCSPKVAVDAVYNSESIAITNKEPLEKSGVIFCSISEAIRKYPDLIKKYLGRVVPSDDNYYAALNTAVFSDGSFCYIPKNTRCPMPLSSYFRMNSIENTGQFERTLIVAEEGSFVEYSEGCTAISHDKNQLHAAVVELYCAEGAEIKYSTRGLCAGDRSKISWTQVEKGFAITWKYPSVVLEGDDSVGEAENARNTSTCDSMLIGDNAAANTYPYIQVKNPSARIEHEASTSKIGEDQIFYFQQRGIDHERALAAMISGFCRDVFNKLPNEFGAEVNQLLSIKLEGSVG
ncbi:Stabilizer of iron transporter SufD superfamily protein [Arabidopsis thaliana]|uniref:Iron-sulfur cluster assembly SufBD family protein ABCI9 n=1 Tax=Arabidopsis thaliana TaxID=3702 RepID=AB9I_ARATH|nr:Stabilizer of iron transporter SufD superfamily protein [Arabidopsis thaliana]Q3E8H7.1 RecName: Full=Iron-sulfur cluster assembly SufBD family protein ABCI9; AltName: Full=ABC transporter I family member 9; Short=ABC transporter ABCI.9; Short=AtABCI9 [Arabidopsis thaliana]AED95095.1 Stabilizer of iron transporter SufD superfamily protein [Arabidopsis thaliana]|eukprot:NP_680390.1 Stabilizer of iron transporter SufD superfamily protein [Arabidopsis thaliana]